jgi:hypothetical protein
MSPEAKELLGQKIEQLKKFRDSDEIAINARDLRAFNFEVDSTIPDSNPMFLTVSDLRAVAAAESIEPVEEDCGCPKTE